MAGQGWREWVAGEQLTDEKMQQFLQDQAVMRFDNASARTTALNGVVSEGMVSYLNDTNALEVYDGAAWGAVTPDVASATNTSEGTMFGFTNGTANSSFSVALGFNAGGATQPNASIIGNAVVGVIAGRDITTGHTNSILGNEAGRNLTTGSLNAVVGAVAGSQLTTGGTNTLIGGFAGFSITTGSNNTLIGAAAGLNQTTTSQTVGVGSDCLYNNTGAANVAVGHQALYTNTSSQGNVAVGFRALFNTTGAGNTAVGDAAGGDYLVGTVTGANNTSLGAAATPTTTSVSNQITLGNSSVTSLRCQVTTISALSDIRDKTNVQDSTYGLELINQLRPVTFDWNMRDGAKVGVPDVGFIAQELAAVEDNYDAERLALTLRDNPDKLEATPGRLIPILVKAIQELTARVEELENAR
jgi:hypothetical protein